MSANPKTKKKPTTNPTKYLHQYLADQDILSAHSLQMHGLKMPVPYGCTAILGSAGLGEAFGDVFFFTFLPSFT